MGIENLPSIGGDLVISGNAALPGLTGLENMTSIGGSLEISFNDSLTSLMGIENLPSIGGGLVISGNAALPGLTGLENMTSIGGSLEISFNDSLTSLMGLWNLIYIEGELEISYNAALTSLAGLDNIDRESISTMLIANNNFLSTCEVKSICAWIATPTAIYQIYQNAPGCNSPAEVYAACHAGLENTPENGICTIYPNPSSGLFTFEFYLQQPCMVNLVVHNSLGQVVASLANGVLASGPQQVFWNSGKLPAGVYYCRLQAGAQTYTNKIIKIQ
jgi:hypothetical protein